MTEPARPGGRFRAVWEDALAQARQAVADAPTSATAHTAVAESCIALWCFGFEPRGTILKPGRVAVERSLQIDPNLSRAHTTLGILQLADWEWTRAEKSFERAVALDPSSPSARHWHALYLAAMGRHGKAQAESRKAVSLDQAGSYQVGLGAVLYFAHDFAEMARVMEEAVAAEANSAPAHDWLGMAYVQLGRYDDAIEVYRRAVTLSDNTPEILAGLGHAYGIAGRKGEAAKVLAELTGMSRRWYVPPVQIAYVHASLGQTREVFLMLDEAVRQRSWELVFVREEPWFDHLHSDPRFTRVVEQMQFPS